MPFATQTGANTFGCLIDGVPFVVTGPYGWLRGFGIEYTFYKDGSLIMNIISQGLTKEIYITSKIGINTIGSHDVNKYKDPGYTSANLHEGLIPGVVGYYEANENLPATITITKYTSDRNSKTGDILSGTFDMVLENAKYQKVHITEGRFDITHQ